MYINIEELVNTIVERFNDDDNTDDIYDIIRDEIDIEISNNNYKGNKLMIEDYYEKDIIDAINEYKEEYGELDITDKEQTYALLCHKYIFDDIISNAIIEKIIENE